MLQTPWFLSRPRKNHGSMAGALRRTVAQHALRFRLRPAPSRLHRRGSAITRRPCRGWFASLPSATGGTRRSCGASSPRSWPRPLPGRRSGDLCQSERHTSREARPSLVAMPGRGNVTWASAPASLAGGVFGALDAELLGYGRFGCERATRLGRPRCTGMGRPSDESPRGDTDRSAPREVVVAASSWTLAQTHLATELATWWLAGC